MAQVGVPEAPPTQGGDIFDQLPDAAPTHPKGDIFDQLPDTPAKSPPSLWQRYKNNFEAGQAAIDEAATPPPVTSVGSTANALGAGATRVVLSPIAHPVRTAEGVGTMLRAAMGDTAAQQEFGQSVVEPFVRNPSGEAVAAIPQAALALAGGWEGFKKAYDAKFPAPTWRIPGAPVPAPEGFAEPIPKIATEPVTPAAEPAPQAAAPAVRPPLPTAGDIFDQLAEPEHVPGTQIHAGPKPVPEAPPAPVASQVEPQSLLDKIVAETGISRDNPVALRDAIAETGRRALAQGDDATAHAAAQEGSILDQAIRTPAANVEPTAPTGRPLPPNLAAAAAALTGKPLGQPSAPVQTAPSPAPAAGTPPQQPAAAQGASQPPPGTAQGARPTVQASQNPTDLRESAQEQQPKLEQMADNIAAAIPGAEVVGPRVKSADSIENKDDRGKPAETNIDNLAVRVVAPSPDAVPAVQQAIESQLPVVSKDKIDNNGLNIPQYGIKTGGPGEPNQVSELQVVPSPAVADAMKATDSLYEQQKGALARMQTALDRNQPEDAAKEKATADRIGAQITQKLDDAKQHGGGGGGSAQPAGTPGAPSAQEVAPNAAPFSPKKGDRVLLGDGRPATVTHVDAKRRMVGIKRDDGRAFPVVPMDKLRPEAPEVGQGASGQNQPVAGQVGQGGEQASQSVQPQIVGPAANTAPPPPSGHVDLDPIGPPIPVRVAQIKAEIAKGTDVRIFTARVALDPEGQARAIVDAWVRQHLGKSLPITNAKDDSNGAILDDHAGVKPNANEPMDIPEIPSGRWLGVDIDKTLAYTDKGANAKKPITDKDKEIAEKYFNPDKKGTIASPVPVMAKDEASNIKASRLKWLEAHPEFKDKDPKNEDFSENLPVGPVEMVDPSKVFSVGQENINQDIVRKYADAHGKHEPVVMFEKGEKYLITNGHHRVAAALMNGEKVPARVIHLGEGEQTNANEPGISGQQSAAAKTEDRGREQRHAIQEQSAAAVGKQPGGEEGAGRPVGSERVEREHAGRGTPGESGQGSGQEKPLGQPGGGEGKEEVKAKPSFYKPTVESESKSNESSTVTPTPKPVETAAERFKRAQKAKSDKYLDTQVRRESGQLSTRRAIIDERMAGGGTTSVKQVEDDAATRKLDRELGAMRRAGVPTGNQSHPTTIKYNELRAQQKAGIKVPSYRVTGADGTEWIVSKTEYDYAKSIEGKEIPKESPAVSAPVEKPVEVAEKPAPIKTEANAEEQLKQEKSATQPKSDLGATFGAFGFANPELFNRLFPDIASRIADWVTDEPTTEKLQKEMMRETRGQMDRRVAIAMFKLRDAAKYWTTRSRDESKRFWNAVESGDLSRLGSNRDRDLADVFKAAFDSMRTQLQALKPEILQNYIENYFPHIWERPSHVSSVLKGLLTGKRPFAGKAGFLKQRTIPTMQDGLDLGFEPKTWNPVESFLMKYAEMAQFLMAHQTLEVMKNSGTAKYVRISKKAPDGWIQLDDRIGTVYRRVMALDEDKLEDVTQPLTYPGGTRKIPGAFSEDIEEATHGEIALVGHYYAPADAAKVFNNFVSKGIARRWAVYDTLRWMNDNLNALQLGISAFHATTISVVGQASDLALGIQQLTEGKPVQFGASLARWAMVVPSIFNTARNGSKLMREYLNPGSYSKMSKEAAGVAIAGGRIKQNVIEIKPLNKAINAFRNGAILQGLSAVPGAVLQSATALVMEYYVPRMKLGIFYGLAHDILDEAGKGKLDPEKVRGRLDEAWNSVDNRAGQMVYENLFWNKAVRDMVQLGTRSVGWNYGSFAEAFGAVTGAVRIAGSVLTGKKPRLTPALAFALALPMTTALIGGSFNYMRTGKAPETLKDYFYLKSADGTYLNIPGYMKDVFSFAHDPVGTVENKLGPLWEASVEMLHNKDFYGVEIRHKDDPLVSQVGDVAKWAAKQAIPFSFSSAGKLLEHKGAQPTLGSMLEEAAKHPTDVLAGQLGFTPAPAFIQNSKAVNMAREYGQANRPAGTRTKEQAARTQAMHVVEDMYRAHKVDQQVIAEYKKDGILNEADLVRARLYARTSPLIPAVRSLSPEQALNVYVAGTPAEQKELRPLIEMKGRELGKIEDAHQRDTLKKAYHDALNPKPKFQPGKPIA